MRWPGLVLTCLGLLYLSENVHGLAVMSIDLGSEWMKIGIVSVRMTQSDIHLLMIDKASYCYHSV